MQLPHGVLSRDALCFEALGAGAEAAALLWTLAPNLVLRCVAYRRPHPAGAPQAGAGPQRRTAEGGGGGLLASLFDQLPRNEQAEAIALRPPAGSDYPSCCAFVLGGLGRYLLVGYPSGKVGV